MGINVLPNIDKKPMLIRLIKQKKMPHFCYFDGNDLSGEQQT